MTGQASSGDVDVTIFSDGDIEGTITVADGATARIVKIGATDYVGGGAAYWTASGWGSAVAKTISDRWGVIPDSSTNLGNTLAIAAIATKVVHDLHGWSFVAPARCSNSPRCSYIRPAHFMASASPRLVLRIL